jgi:anti-anti-sigma factor
VQVFPSGHDQGRSIFTITGDIDLATAGDLLVRLTAVIGSARRDIGLDLSGVTFIDCAGLRTLAAVNDLVRANGATTVLTATSPAVTRLLELVDAARNTTVPAVVRMDIGTTAPLVAGQTATAEPPACIGGTTRRPEGNTDTRMRPVALS